MLLLLIIIIFLCLAIFVDTLNKSMELLELRNVTLIQKLDFRTIEQIVYLIKLSMKEIRKRLFVFIRIYLFELKIKLCTILLGLNVMIYNKI